MNRRLVALAAAFVLLVSSAAPGMAGVRTSGPDTASAPAPAAPASPVDESKVPHYFGPYPNWANSPLTLPDATVTINGDGSGAAATATVGANGAVTGLTITNPGSGYTAATVDITGTGTGATASATVTASSAVTAVNVTAGGNGYTAPTVTFSGGGTTGLPVTPPKVTPAATDTWDVSAGSATGGSFILTVDTVSTAAIPFPAAAADIDAALLAAGITTVTSGSGPWSIVFATAPAAVSIDGTALTQGVSDTSSAESATLGVWDVSAGSATGGTFTLSVDGATPTAPLAWNASAADIDAALLAAGITTVTSGSGPWSIDFNPVHPAAVAIDAAALTQGATGATATAAPTRDFVLDLGSATGGTFTLSVDGTPTPALAWNAAAGTIEAALPAGAVVTGTGPFSVKLATAPGTFTVDGALLTETLSSPTAQASGTVYGGVDAVTIDVQGEGYRFPTVDFDLPDDPNGVQAKGIALCDSAHPDCKMASDTDTASVIGVLVTDTGSGYATAPGVVIRNGTQFDPINPGAGFVEAKATATLTIQSVVLDTFGSGYTTAPTVTFADATGTGSGAAATASTAIGSVTAINLTAGGSGYIKPGIRKFEDALPGLCLPPACPTSGKYIPLAVAEAKSYNGVEADEYVIGLVQYKTNFSSSLPDTLVRGYIQLETPANERVSQHWPVTNTLANGTEVPVMKADGVTQWLAVTPPQWLGPTIGATKDRAVRIEFHNLLPTGMDGNLFLPVDSTLMGSGMGPNMTDMPVNSGTVMDEVRNPKCTDDPNMAGCFAQNRATLHLHGGTTPWISDGTPHQWITPAGETTDYPQGVSVQNVPDMNVCNAADDGCQTFYYTNQQSARLMFYHDHAWGITRLNVYAGEAAGYVITDDTEKKLIKDGTIPGADDTIPLVVQDRTFVPDAAQLALQDPTWDSVRWGTKGSFWYHHVYMPAQNPGDPSGMSAYGRWMYGPWFWPPAAPQYPPIANPYYDPACDLNNPATWTYQVDPFCEPKEIPGTPNISVGMEQFNDTPIVNGVAYPTITLEPKAYRLRMLNAANDRFMNFQWYVGDPTTASTSMNKLAVPEVIGATEVALNPAEVAAAQTDINVFPTPVQSSATAGPDWIQIGTEGGFLPAPAIVDGQQPTTWITDPTRFDVGNVDKHSLLLAPAERADAIVDFSKYAGKTLILYNDAPAAFPARVAGYDYYTGAPDTGAGQIIPGFGPNTRTVMQVKIAGTAAPAFNLTKLQAAFKHHADGSGVFESGQHPIIVGQAAYNSAYGTSFVASGDCTNPTGTNKCDGLARINQQGGQLFRFDNLKKSNPQLTIPLQPKALHDEMNSAAFDEFGRMTANLGLEAVPATPAGQNILLYPYIAPPTEVIDGTNLPKGDVNVQAISDAKDGTQIWKITHNGVDTHPIHFHLYDVQILNRVTWDNIIIPTEPSELGWKDTIRVSPLEDTIVALRPIIPTLPFEIPNAIRPLSPMAPVGANLDPNGLIVDPTGNVTTVTNALVNFGWEYVYHCHILSHEEMDMMRPVLLALPPLAADGLAWSVTGNGNNTRLTLTFNDNSITETAFTVQRKAGTGAFTDLGTLTSPLDQPNTHGTRTFTDTTFRWNSTVYSYRVVAKNTVGYGGAYPSTTTESISPEIAVIAAPTGLSAAIQAGPTRVNLTWTDNAANETGFVLQRSDNGGAFTQIATPPARNNTGSTSFTDTSVALGNSYQYRVAAVSSLVAGQSAWSNVATANVSVPLAPSGVTAANGPNQGSNRSVVLTWVDNSNNESGFVVQRATNAAFTTGVASTNVAANATGTTITGLTRNTSYYFRVWSTNVLGSSAQVNASPFPILTLP